MMPPAGDSGQHSFPRTMKNPYRGGKVYTRAKFGGISIKDTVKERLTRLGGSNSLAARQKRQLPSLRSRSLDTQACHNRSALSALYRLRPQTAVPLRTAIVALTLGMVRSSLPLQFLLDFRQSESSSSSRF
jgi:hypothetical protein